VHLTVLDYLDTPLVEAASAFVPTQTIYESGGSWINNEGRLQAADALIAGGEPIATTAAGDHPPRMFEKSTPGSAPLPAWQALLALAGDTDDRAAETMDAAVRELHPCVRLPLRNGIGRRVRLVLSSGSQAVGSEADSHDLAGHPDNGILLLLVDWTFGTESLSAMSPTVNQVGALPAASLHPDTVGRLGLADEKCITISAGGAELSLSLQLDPRVAPGVMVVPRHHQLDWQLFDDTCAMLQGSQLKAEKNGG
jgi:NADH-quinone oxidoreductase subunit G